ncbi:hypothetical protein PTKIN_Ptkin16aG0492100 [Pterospermum kingtungense]
MELQHFSHQHPLVFFEETSLEHEKVFCSGCGEMVSGPTFNCVGCAFHLHKQCAEAPSEMNHPCHRNHSLRLLVSSPYQSGRIICDFCDKICERFVYHCSCGLDLHIKCALFSYNIAEKRIAEFQHIARIDPLISTESRPEKLKNAQCFACWKPLLDSLYFSPDCGFYLHVKCVDLPPEINHLLHPQHPLILQFDKQPYLSCQICQKPQRRGLVYSCSSPCEFVLHIECATIPTKVNHLCHRKHPLTLQFEDGSDLPCQFALHIGYAAIPTKLNQLYYHRKHPLTLQSAAYKCKSCNFNLHRDCMTLPLTARHKSDEHPYKLTYHDNKNYPESNYCDICEEERNPNLWFYHCAICDNSAHPDCALGKYTFFKLGSIYTKGDHPHPLTFVKKDHHYPECHRCGDRCLDLALECKTTGCSYIVHWECPEKESNESESSEETESSE